MFLIEELASSAIDEWRHPFTIDITRKENISFIPDLLNSFPMKTVLVIDSNPHLLKSIAKILIRAHYRVVTSTHGEEGVTLAQQEMPDLVLCDMMMPHFDGYSVLRMLGINPATAHIPFIFLLAKAEKEENCVGMNLRADDYITKPFDNSSLLEAIAMRLRKNENFSTEMPNVIHRIDVHSMESHGVEELNKLLNEKSSTLIVRKKQEIFSEGNYPSALYYNTNGMVKTYKTNPQGREFIIGLHQEGEFIGYLDLLEGGDHTESATALEDTELALIKRQDFLYMLHHNWEISKKFIQLLADNLADQEEKLLKLAYNSVRKRVAETLVQLSQSFRPSEHAAAMIRMSREDLSGLIGASKETVIRTLSDFKEEKLIEINPHGIHILNLGQLQRMRN
jgi:CRP-like cAMP-binding protein